MALNLKVGNTIEVVIPDVCNTCASSAPNCDFHWVFPNRSAMATFCHELFDLRMSRVDETRGVIEAQLGIDVLQGGLLGLRWAL